MGESVLRLIEGSVMKKGIRNCCDYSQLSFIVGGEGENMRRDENLRMYKTRTGGEKPGPEGVFFGVCCLGVVCVVCFLL